MSKIFRLLMLLAFVLSGLSAPAFAQNNEINQWLSEQESLTLSVALDKLSRLIQLESGVTQQDDLSEIPEELRGLLATPSNFTFTEQRNLLLYGDSAHKGLLESIGELTIADYNKFVLASILLYRDHPAARAEVESLIRQMQALYEHQQNNDHMRPGHNITEKAFFAVGLLFISRTAFHAGKALLGGKLPWSRLSSATRGSRLYIGTSSRLPVALNQTVLQRTQSFLQTRKGILALHSGAAVLGGIYGGVESYYYFLQTKKVSPLETLQFVQADLACELATGSVDFRTTTETISSPLSWEDLETMSIELEAATQLNDELSQSFSSLVDLWTKDQPGWKAIRTSLEDQLATEGPRVSCERISTENIRLDLDQARFNIQNILRSTLLESDSGEVLNASKDRVLEIHSEWLSTQDDLVYHLHAEGSR